LHLVEREGPDLDYELDAIGNLTAQTGVGVYEYSGPDADEGYLLRGVDGATDYFYDDNGTAIQRTGPLVHNGAQQIIPNAFDLPKSVEMSGVGQTIDFEYSAFGERAAKLGPVGASGNTLYVGESYRREQLDPDVDAFLHHYRVFAGNRQVAQVTRIEINGTVPAEAVRYLHHDLVGSVEVITDESGNVVHSQRFDPFGNTDNPSWASTFILTGFTGHEHDPDLGLINMKGRLYDPAIGRFISADPYVQYPLWSQSLNRYSYGFNNPMSGSDPSGYAWDVDGWMDKVFGNSTGWESATLPAYLGLVTLGASAGGLAASNFGGGVAGIATSGSDYAGLYDMPSEYTGPAPMGAFGGSQGGMYNGGAMAPAAGPDMRVAQAGGQDVLGPFVVTGSTDPPVIIPPSPPPLRLSDPTGMRPNQWSTLPPLVNIGVSASAMSTIASFFYPLSGGLSGGGAGFGVFIDTSRASIGLYSRIDGRFAAGHYAGISGEVGATLDANAFFGEGDSNFVEFGKGSTFGGRTSGSFGSGGSVSFSRGRGYGFAVGKSYSYTWRLLEWSPL
ncbi:MAG TPA: RHS repeat-associated core domain-containing protein, partial [Polyangiaceae bacterium]